MSSANVEILKRMFDAFNGGDLAAALEDVGPEIEAEPSSSFPGRSVYRGHQGVLEFFATFLEVWDEYAAEPTDFIEAGDRVLVIARQRGRGKGSGLEIEQDIFQIWTMRDGKAIRMRVCEGRADALEALDPPD
jgi:uncharacterized protein